MNPLKKGQLREEDRYMWGCGRSPHPHIYPSLLLAGVFFSALITSNRDVLSMNRKVQLDRREKIRVPFVWRPI